MNAELDRVLGNARACLKSDPEIFFADDPAPAKAICSACPVVDLCRAYALATKEPSGVWGALSPIERSHWHRFPAPRRARILAAAATGVLTEDEEDALDHKSDRKTCLACRRSRPMRRFKGDPKTADGYVNQCRACIAARRRERESVAAAA